MKHLLFRWQMNDITSKKYSLYSKKFLDKLRLLIKTIIADDSAYLSGTKSKSLKLLLEIRF